MQLKTVAFLAASFAVSAGACFAQGTGHYNIVGRTTAAPGGHGRINVEGGGQDVGALELDVTDGPLNITRVVVYFADRKLKPWASPIAPRAVAAWTSRPINWPSKKVHRVTAVEYWYTGKTGKSPNIALLGLQ